MRKPIDQMDNPGAYLGIVLEQRHKLFEMKHLADLRSPSQKRAKFEYPSHHTHKKA